MKNFVAVVFAFFCALLLLLPESEAIPTLADQNVEADAAVENDHGSVQELEELSGGQINEDTRGNRQRRDVCASTRTNGPLRNYYERKCDNLCAAKKQGERGLCVNGTCICAN